MVLVKHKLNINMPEKLYIKLNERKKRSLLEWSDFMKYLLDLVSRPKEYQHHYQMRYDDNKIKLFSIQINEDHFISLNEFCAVFRNYKEALDYIIYEEEFGSFEKRMNFSFS